jgi:hypothetical protein
MIRITPNHGIFDHAPCSQLHVAVELQDFTPGSLRRVIRDELLVTRTRLCHLGILLRYFPEEALQSRSLAATGTSKVLVAQPYSASLL